MGNPDCDFSNPFLCGLGSLFGNDRFWFSSEYLLWWGKAANLPPLATTHFSPGVDMSLSRTPVSSSRTSVPSGILRVMSSPARPFMSLPMPCAPERARCCCSKRKSRSVVS